jgi:L-lactate dehydrogenase
MSDTWNLRKVVIVAASVVGSTFAYALAQSGLAGEIVLLDANHELAVGQVLDLDHGQAFFPSVQIREAPAADYFDARLIVITAGAKQRSGESRLEPLQRNTRIIDDIVRQASTAMVLLVSNPVDILTYVAHERSGWRRGRIIGSGTVLHGARFRHLLSQHCGVDVHNVHAYMMREHGDSEHTAPFDALVQTVEGEAEIVISGQSRHLHGGEMILMPAGNPHALKAVHRFKMILTMIRS